ncbi:MAG TPA: cell wall anchor protein, partial [Actinomycetota bacterium]
MAATAAGLTLLPATAAQAAVPGGVLAWGSDTPFQGKIPGTLPGQLCDGGAADQPVAVPAAAPANANVTAISTQKDHTLAVIGGAVFACGLNRFGQLGDNTVANKAVPVAAAAPANANITAVSAGWDHSLALSVTGTVYAWGQNRWGQLGDGTLVDKNAPVAVGFPAGTVITAIAAGAYFSLSLDSSGQVWGWGFSGYGEA